MKKKEKTVDISDLAAVLGELIGDNEPTDEELNYDDDYIELYNEMHNLKKALENVGYSVEGEE